MFPKMSENEVFIKLEKRAPHFLIFFYQSKIERALVLLSRLVAHAIKKKQKSRAKPIGAASGKQAHQAEDNKTNLKMNSTDKTKTDENLKEETQKDPET